jgi:hypothetical protein
MRCHVVLAHRRRHRGNPERITMTRPASRITICALMALTLLHGTVGAQSRTKADPWRVVPDLPKTCDPANDVADRLDKAIEANKADEAKQTKINDGVKALLDSIDGATKARNMQAYMMKNPQEAMKAMQAANAASAGVEALFGDNRDPYKDEEFKGPLEEFHVAANKAQVPVHAQIKQLVDTRSKPAEAEFYFPDAADQRKYDALREQLKTEYDKTCMSYLGPGGKLQTWLSDYRSYLATEVVPKLDESGRAGAQYMVMILGDAANAFQSTASWDGVNLFLTKAAAAYGIRRPPDATASRKP